MLTSSDDGYTLCAMVPEAEFSNNTVQKVVTVLVAFAIISILISCYCQFLYTDDRRRREEGLASEGSFLLLGKNHILNRAFIKKSLPILIVGTIGMFAVSWYTQSLMSVSVQIKHNDNKVASIEEQLAANENASQEIEDDYSAEYIDRAVGLARLFAVDPGLIEDNRLEDMAVLMGLESIFVFDENGQTISTNTRNKNFALPEDENDQSYGFWEVVNGVEPYYVQTVVWDGNAGITFYVGVERYDAKGMVEIGVSSTTLAERLSATAFEGQLDSIPVGNGGFLAAVDAQEGTVSYMRDHKYIDDDPANHGITASALVDGYLGYQVVDGVRCLVSTCYTQGQYILVCVPTSEIGTGNVSASIVTALLGFVLLIPVVLQLVIQRRPEGDDVVAEEGRSATSGSILAQPRGSFDIKTAGGSVKRVQSIAGRWGGVSLDWNEKNPEGKLFTIVKGLLLVVTVVLLVFVYGINDPNDSSALSYIVSERWEKLPNIFSLSYIGLLILTAAVAVWVTRVVITIVCRNLNTRLETIGRLLASFIKYAVVIAVLLYSLALIGVDSASLWASAGIVTLVVGLGAQSLIKDVIAGIFLVFEGEFRVGDIVTVGGWTGTVLEIGIRTTKIEDGSQNIKDLVISQCLSQITTRPSPTW